MGLSMTIAVAGATSSPHDSARAKQTQGPSGFEEATFLFFFFACCMSDVHKRPRQRGCKAHVLIPTVLASAHSDSGTHFRPVETVSPSRIKDCSTARNSVRSARSAGAKVQCCRLTGELGLLSVLPCKNKEALISTA